MVGLSGVGTDEAITKYIQCHLQNVNNFDSVGVFLLIAQKGLKSRRIFVEQSGIFATKAKTTCKFDEFIKKINVFISFSTFSKLH